MEDYFALLGEPRRPWLDPEEVKEAFHRLSRTQHPDQQETENGQFARSNAAQATLREPKARLRHLIELEYPDVGLSGPSQVPTGLADRFVAIHELLRETDGLLVKEAAAPSALAKALLAREEFGAREQVEQALQVLGAVLSTAEDELRVLDASWMQARPANADVILLDFYQRFSYLTRWIEQLRERLFQLGI